jgi:DNA-binding transcriptional LysR family regulator
MLLDVTSSEPAGAAEHYDRYDVDAVYAWQLPDRPLALTRPAAVRAVLDEPLWVALPAAHPSARRPTVALRELAADRWITGSTEQARQLTHAACTASGFAPHIGYTADSAATARSMICNEVGVALVSPLTVPPAAGAGIVLRPLRDGPRRRHLLAFDSSTVDERLVDVLVHRLRCCYAVTAVRRNPSYRACPDFPVAPGTAGGGFDPALLAGLGAAGDLAARHRRIGLHDLHLLRVVCSAGSLNRAARVLLISQPALSRRIDRLERALGIGLFVRSHRGTGLAPAARALLDEVTGAEAAFHATLASIRTEGAPERPIPSHTVLMG